MTVDLQELRRLAEEATPGPYHVRRSEPEGMVPYDAVVASDNNYTRCCIYTHDAHYIAACDPATILSLLTELETLRDTNQRLNRRCQQLESEKASVADMAASLSAGGRHSGRKTAAGVLADRVAALSDELALARKVVEAAPFATADCDGLDVSCPFCKTLAAYRAAYPAKEGA